MTISPVTSGPSWSDEIHDALPPRVPDAPVTAVAPVTADDTPEEVATRPGRTLAQAEADRAVAAGERALAEDALRVELDAALDADLIHADVDWSRASVPRVRELQNELDVRGFDPGPIDGIFGPRTRSALEQARAVAPSVNIPAESVEQPEVAPLDPNRASPLGSLPPRPEGAVTGSEFLALTADLDPEQREDAIAREILLGNVPDFLRDGRTVTITGTGVDGAPQTIDLDVTPDYLAIGSDQDFVRIPMTPETAQRIADATGSSLPTTRIVDEIYAAAEGRLAPAPLPPGPGMTTNDYYGRHQARVEEQRIAAGFENGDLLAGHRKDVVLTNRLASQPDRVAIYGWHQPNGRPIQSLSLVHGAYYADYSHGVRLVDGRARVNGTWRPLADVLADPNVAHLLSAEGPLRVTRQP